MRKDRGEEVNLRRNGLTIRQQKITVFDEITTEREEWKSRHEITNKLGEG
jgi:hypothetical protein